MGADGRVSIGSFLYHSAYSWTLHIPKYAVHRIFGVLAAKTPEAVNASSSGCAKQASMRNCAMSSLLLSRLIYFSDLSREARSTPGDKPPLDHKDVGVTEVLQGRHRADRFVTIVTIDDQRYVLGGRFTRDLAL